MRDGRGWGARARTSRAPLTDSSHRSMMNSSNAMDSLSMLMSRWQSLECRRHGKLLWARWAPAARW